MDTQRLKPIQQTAESREQSRAKVFGERGRALDAQQKRLDELANYAREYAQTTPQGATVTASMLQNRSALLDRLDDAVKTQDQGGRQGQGKCLWRLLGLSIVDALDQII